MESIIGHRIDYNGVGALRGKWHIPSKNWPKYPPLPGWLHPFLFCSKWFSLHLPRNDLFLALMSLSLLILVQSCNIISIAAIIIKLCPNNGSSKRRPNLQGKQVSSHVKMISLISSLSLKLYLNSLVYNLWVFLKSLRQYYLSSDIFRISRKMFGNIRLAFGTILENLWKSSENGQKSSENHQKHRRQYVYIIKRTLHISSKIWMLCSRGKNNISRVSTIVLATRT